MLLIIHSLAVRFIYKIIIIFIIIFSTLIGRVNAHFHTLTSK